MSTMVTSGVVPSMIADRGLVLGCGQAVYPLKLLAALEMLVDFRISISVRVVLRPGVVGSISLSALVPDDDLLMDELEDSRDMGGGVVGEPSDDGTGCGGSISLLAI